MSSGLASHTWRRCLRFSVRGLMLLTLVIGAGMGWVVRGARIQREAVAAIERERGDVIYKGEHIAQGCYNGRDCGRVSHEIPEGVAWAPPWLVDLIGIDYFHHVATVYLADVPNGAKLESAGRFSLLEELTLIDAVVDDDDLANLTGLTKLSSLVLDRTTITDAGLVHLSGLANLSKVKLRGTRITDAGLMHLKRLKKLSYLDLHSTEVTDAGVEQLKQALPSLKVAR